MKTLGFKEKETGWVSFFSFLPDAYLRLGGTAFVIKDGNLWQQNDKSNPITNTFFGVKYPSKINTVFNEVQTDDKIFKTFVIEGSSSWDVEIKTNLTKTSLKATDFNKKESRYFAYLRGNEQEGDLNGNAQGVGICQSNNSDTLFFKRVSELTNVGDQLFKLDGDQSLLIGNIIDKSETSIRVDVNLVDSYNGFFILSSRNARIDGGEIRGYYADIEMINNDDKQVELFAINSNIVKSYV
ncbi:hypothetical protein ACKUSY_05700 [Myroides odoratus]|uniref:Crassvirus muzzle protein C-terminal domain-containing protein n=1 Tax=Myroides odoratus TaxID=256 RepID=A0A378RQC6_MYROD|nr:hypothetical protein [Myroides odoratus]QQU04220.1 hypothetical protein I6I89_02740 [Myroides odoratus]STZ28367.1 Uncharacterised protein [Myroides odoratus]